MQGSKYVYSKPGDIFIDIRSELEKGVKVLFTGLPCQVAGLNKYLGKEYENLITVDLICSGVPSEKVFRSYVDCISNGKKIVSINMRPKKYGWDEDGIETKFDDESEYMIHGIKDPYLKAYLKKLYNSDCCYDCKFATMPRVADLTIGDFWHVNKLFDDEDHSDGISCILLNSEKAECFWNMINYSFSYKKSIPASFLRRFNMFGAKRNGHLARDRFFEMLDKNVKFDKAVRDCLEWRFDVALSGCWTVRNYGGELTYYALYNALKSFGKTVIMVERRANIKGYDIPKVSAFRYDPYPFYDVSRIHKSFDDQKELNVRVKNFVVGSDQVWNYKLMNHESVMSWSFDYVAPFRNKISYASSFGNSGFEGGENEKELFSANLKSFNHISTREESGVKLIKELTDKDAEWVVDPAFLCEKDNFIELAGKSRCSSNNHMLAYIVHPSPIIDGIDKIAEKLSLDMRLVVGFGAGISNMPKDNELPYSCENNCSLEDWLYLLIHCKYLVTTSFHALCLAIIFKKPFVFLQGGMTEEHGFDRIKTLLSKCGLMNRVLANSNDVLSSSTLDEDINWENVYSQLQPEIDRSRQWLIDSLV